MRAGKLLLVVAALAGTWYSIRSWRAAPSDEGPFLWVGEIADFPKNTVVVRGPT